MKDHFDAKVMAKKIKQNINKMWTLIKRTRLSELAIGEKHKTTTTTITNKKWRTSNGKIVFWPPKWYSKANMILRFILPCSIRVVHKFSVDLWPNYIMYFQISFNDGVIKWKHFPRNWPFVRGIHRSPVNSPHKGQWRGALMFSLICVWINGWVNNLVIWDAIAPIMTSP